MRFTLKPGPSSRTQKRPHGRSSKRGDPSMVSSSYMLVMYPMASSVLGLSGAKSRGVGERGVRIDGVVATAPGDLLLQQISDGDHRGEQEDGPRRPGER